MKVQNALTRFSDRVDDYVKHRPGYPPAVITILQSRCGLTPGAAIADIGSGPGNLARLFLENGNQVFGVEPNAEMRAAGQQILGHFGGYRSVEGTAEDTRLPSASADFITAAQAFHWFDWPRAKAEFRRILRPQGWVVLLWNDRRLDATPFSREYEALLTRFGTDYSQVKDRSQDSLKAIIEFFVDRFETIALPNSQIFDLEGLRGRLLSSSYAPKAGHPNYAPMLETLRELFQAHASGGKVSFEYDTNIYFGQLR